MTVGQVFNDPLRGISIQNMGAERRRRHAGHHDAGRHDAAQPSGQAVGGRQRHERRAAVDARARRLRGRFLPRRTRRRPARLDGDRRVRRQRPHARSHGQLRRDRHRRGGNVGPAATMAVDAARHGGAERARERHGDRDQGRPGAHRLGGGDRQRRRRRYRVLRDGTGIAQATATTYVDTARRGRAAARPSPTPSSRSTSVGNASAPGAAPPLRAALLRTAGRLAPQGEAGQEEHARARHGHRSRTPRRSAVCGSAGEPGTAARSSRTAPSRSARAASASSR